MKKIWSPKRQKRINWRKLQINIFLSFVFLAFGFVGGSHLYTEMTLDKFAPTAFAKEEPVSMREWVLAEVRKAGIDEYKAWSIINCESKWKPDSFLVNSDKSVDRGIWAINSKYHKEVSNACAYDFKCATQEAIRIYKKTNSFREWVCNKL